MSEFFRIKLEEARANGVLVGIAWEKVVIGVRFLRYGRNDKVESESAPIRFFVPAGRNSE